MGSEVFVLSGLAGPGVLCLHMSHDDSWLHVQCASRDLLMYVGISRLKHGTCLASSLLQIMTFSENLKTLTADMSFSVSLAAGALVDAKNDLSAAANLCTELS